jgi:hypothetical protein
LYLKALLNFELCVAQCYQGLEMLKAASGKPFFVSGDDSDGERPNKLYNASKHADERIDKGALPTDATAPIWVTNEGLESNEAKLKFAELFEMLRQMGTLADRLSTLSPMAPEAATEASEPGVDPGVDLGKPKIIESAQG